MNKLSQLSRAICNGRLIWVQSPSSRSGVYFTKKLLNRLGVHDRAMIYFSALQFIQLSNEGFTEDFWKINKMILVGELENLNIKTRAKLMKKLSGYQSLKHQFNVNLILVSPILPDLLSMIQESLNPHLFQLFKGPFSTGVNEKIHHCIESASLELKKPIWRISVEAAEYLEFVLLKKGEDHLNRLVLGAIQHSQNKELSKNDLNLSHQCMSFFDTKRDLT